MTEIIIKINKTTFDKFTTELKYITGKFYGKYANDDEMINDLIDNIREMKLHK